MEDRAIERIHAVLDHFAVETPSWGFADTGTRFGKFSQEAAAIDTDDKLADAGQVHGFTGCCPTVAVHVLWDFPHGSDVDAIRQHGEACGVKIGSINPNLFQDQEYKLGSFGHPLEDVRERALRHCLDSIELGKRVESRLVSLWFADGTNYPGQDSIRERKHRFEECLSKCHQQLGPEQQLLVEYKPFEPAFYQTDIADWGMAFHYAKKAGPQAKVLVDTGHHYLTQNIEQIVAWLLDEDMLGGFHFNDRRYADDDLTLGSIDPYQVFRIFNEIHGFVAESNGRSPAIAYMIDQSHNLKPKIEAMIQTVMGAQELYAKAALVDHQRLRRFQKCGEIVDAERELQRAYRTDVTEALGSWRLSKGLAKDPLVAFRESGYASRVAGERQQRRKEMGLCQTSSYA